MNDALLILDARTLKVRVLLICLALSALLAGWFAVRWQIGDMLAELTPPTDPDARNISTAAIILAPADPRARWLAAESEKSIFTTESIDASLRMYADTLRLSPYDFRWWVEYGRAAEQAERPEDAERALDRAIQIAPTYAYPHWQLGNFYLRQGRNEEAFSELRLAASNNYTYRNQVFSLAWDYFGKDPSKVEQLAPDSPDVKADLASFFAARGQSADALRIWNTLSDDDKAAHIDISRSVAHALIQKFAFREAVEFARQAAIDTDAHAETITNGGFETALAYIDDTLFGWRLSKNDGKLEIMADASVKHSGSRSLRVTFRNFLRQDLDCVWQNVAIQASTKYKLSFWVRTENLKSGGLPLIEILNAGDNKILASSQAFPGGTNEWQYETVEFSTPENSDGIFVRSSRGFCGDICPVVGIVWLDDFELSKLPQ